MKKLYLIRHAKSSWSDPTVSDFDRKLNKRGKRDAPFMALRLAATNVKPDLIVSSPAKRAQKTAMIMAQAVGYDRENIVYDEAAYSFSVEHIYDVLRRVGDEHDVVFFVGHNHALTHMAEELSGEELVNVPTSGIVALSCNCNRWRDIAPRCCSLLFFDFPKRHREEK